MRNLKRVLSLALALVMMLSLMVVSSSAKEATRIDFTDADEITYKEAVDVMVALGVIDGGDQGAFEPDGILTREQAAKVICYMLLGPENAENLTTNTQIFTDVAAGRWSAGYISYCANLDILAGTGEGTFLPAGELTGVTFGKMLLVALGYRADIEGYVGDNWATAIASDMVDAGIAVNGVVMTEPLTREQATQMAYQTLEATMVRYTQEPVIINNADGSSVIVNAPDAVQVSNLVNDYRNDPSEVDAYMQFCEKYFPKLTKDSDVDDFYRPGGIWKLGAAEICFSANEPDATFTTTFTPKELYNALGSNVVKAVANDSTLLDVYFNGNSSVDYVLKNSDDAHYDISASLTADRNNTTTKLGGNGVLTEVYVADDDTVTIVVVNTYLAKVDGDYDDDKGELDLTDVDNTTGVDLTTSGAVNTTLSSDDFANLGSFEDGDYVLITVAAGDIKTIELAEIRTGEVTAYNISNKTVTMDGTRYSYTKGYGAGSYNLNNEYNLAMDKYGYVICAEGVKADDNFLYVTDHGLLGGVSGGMEIEAVFTDGTKEVVQVHVDSTAAGVTGGGGSKVTNVAEDTWYAYETKGGKYVLSDVPDDDNSISRAVGGTVNGKDTASANANVVITENGKANVAYDNNINPSSAPRTVSANSGTTFFVMRDSSVTVYNGVRNVPDVTAKAGATGATGITVEIIMDEKGAYADYVMIRGDKNYLSSSGSAAGERIFIVDETNVIKTNDGEKDVYTYEAVLNGKETTITSTDNHLAIGLHTDIAYDGSYVDVATLVTGTVDDTLKQWSLSSEDIKFSKDVLSWTSVSIVLADGCKIFVTDGDDLKTVSATKLANDYNDFTGEVYAVYDGNSAIEIYVDDSGNAGAPPSPPPAPTESITSGTANVAAITAAFTAGKNVEITGGALTLDDALTIPDGKTLTVVTGGIDTSSGALTVEGGLTVTAGGITGTNGVIVNVTNPVATGNDVTITDDVDTEFTVTKGTVKVTGDLNEDTTGVTVGAAGDLTVTGDVKKVADVVASGSLTVTGDVTTIANNHGTVVVTGSVTTVTDNNGTLTVKAAASPLSRTLSDGEVDTITKISAGTVSIEGAVGSVGEIVSGTVTFGGAVTSVTKITAGTVNFEGAATIVAITAGTINVKADVSFAPTAAATPTATFAISAGKTLTLDGTNAAIDLSGATLSGGAEAKVSVQNVDSNNLTADDQLYDSSDDAVTTVSTDTDFTWDASSEHFQSA